MATFPDITPTSLDYRPPKFAIKSTTGLSGVTTRRLFGNKPYNATISMSFDNIPNSIATLILQCWIDANGQSDVVTLPDSIFDGSRDDLLAFTKANSGSGWHFSEEPSLARSAPGYSTVSVQMEASLDFA